MLVGQASLTTPRSWRARLRHGGSDGGSEGRCVACIESIPVPTVVFYGTNAHYFARFLPERRDGRQCSQDYVSATALHFCPTKLSWFPTCRFPHLFVSTLWKSSSMFSSIAFAIAFDFRGERILERLKDTVYVHVFPEGLLNCAPQCNNKAAHSCSRQFARASKGSTTALIEDSSRRLDRVSYSYLVVAGARVLGYRCWKSDLCSAFPAHQTRPTIPQITISALFRYQGNLRRQHWLGRVERRDHEDHGICEGNVIRHTTCSEARPRRLWSGTSRTILN